MSYQPIEKPIPEYCYGEKVFGRKRDCEDFKPFFWDRKHCKLENNCQSKGYHCEGFTGILSRRNKLCTGINEDKWQKIIS